MPDRLTLPPLPEPDATDGYTVYHSDDLLRAYGAAVWRCAMEAAAQRIQALIDEHCAGTKQDPDPLNHCTPDGGCEFVDGWLDAIAALRALPVPGDKP
jgi:hypothetical protein